MSRRSGTMSAVRWVGGLLGGVGVLLLAASLFTPRGGELRTGLSLGGAALVFAGLAVERLRDRPSLPIGRRTICRESRFEA